MNKRLIAFLSILSLSLSLSLIPVNAAVKAGTSCKTVGITSVASGKTFACVKSGKKFVWKILQSNGSNQKVIDVVATPSELQCKADPNVPANWKLYQTFIVTKFGGCDSNFYRYVNYEFAPYVGNSQLTKTQDLLPISSCKVGKVGNGPMLGFSTKQSQITPYSKATFQILPIETNDYSTASKPSVDYANYFELLRTWIEKNSDSGSTFNLRVPEKYIHLNKSLKDYKNINLHTQPTNEGEQFTKDAVLAADPFIDFTGSDLIIIVVPPQVDASLLGTNPWGANVSTNEGNFWRFMSITPFNYDKQTPNAGFFGPQLLLHEMHHGYFDLGDHADGMGAWGLMSLPSATDLLGWEKYIVGFLSDQQIRCLPPTSTSISLIAPSIARTINEKLAIIPINSSRIIVLESMRSGGFNYKLAKASEGLLIYEIDTQETNSEKGEYLITNERGAASIKKFEAPLRLNESVIKYGIKITVIESGSFGDVVKVEKAS